MHRSGFTLSELLIALTLLGIIAAFTIPKVLTSFNGNTHNAKAKAAAFMIQAAYNDYQMENAPTQATKASHLTPFFNYVSVDTVNTYYGLCPVSVDCSALTGSCMRLGSGGMLTANDVTSFGSTSPTNAIPFSFFPEKSTTESIVFFLYYDGTLRTRNNVKDNTANSTFGDIDPTIVCDASWFSWD